MERGAVLVAAVALVLAGGRPGPDGELISILYNFHSILFILLNLPDFERLGHWWRRDLDLPWFGVGVEAEALEGLHLPLLLVLDVVLTVARGENIVCGKNGYVGHLNTKL